MEQSLEQYGRCFREGVRYRAGDAQSLAPLHWGITQQVAMRAVLGLGCDYGQFQAAAVIANEDVGRGDGEPRPGPSPACSSCAWCRTGWARGPAHCWRRWTSGRSVY